MADPSPETPPEGQEPEGAEGQEPATGAEATTGEPQEGSGGRNYSEAYVKQLRREAAASRTQLSDLETRLKEYEDRDKTELEKATAQVAASERRATEAELRLLRYEVATQHGLGMEAAAFLTGSTKEEMELRAEELAKLIADKGRPVSTGGMFDGGARQPVPEQKTPEEAHNDLLLKSLGLGRR